MTQLLHRAFAPFAAAFAVSLPTLAVAAPTTWPLERLPSWASYQIAGMAAWQILALLLLVFIALGIRRVIFLVLSSQLKRMVGDSLPRLNDAVERSAAPLAALTMALVFGIGFPFTGFSETVDAVVHTAVHLVAVSAAVWLVYRQIDVIGAFMEEKAAKTDTKLDDQLVPLVRRTLKVFVVAIGGIFILQNLDVDVASLVAGLGLGGLAFALAAKDTLANLFGSLVIFIDRPFQIGDWVVIDSIEGTVEDVGFRTTRIRTFYNSLVTVPNAKLTQTGIDNMGARQYRRIKVVFGLTYSTTPAQMQAFVEGLRAIVKAHPDTRKDYYEIHFNNFGACSLDVLFYVFLDVPGWSGELKARQELFLSAMELAEKLAVEFAFPTRTLHVDSFPDKAARVVGGRPAPTNEELEAVVRSYGPGAEAANPRYNLTPHGYRAGTPVEGQ